MLNAALATLNAALATLNAASAILNAACGKGRHLCVLLPETCGGWLALGGQLKGRSRERPSSNWSLHLMQGEKNSYPLLSEYQIQLYNTPNIFELIKK